MKKHWFPILVLALITALILPFTAFAGSDETDPDETAVSEEEQPDAQEKESILVKYVVMEGTFVGDAEEALVPFDASTNVLYSTDYSSAIYSTSYLRNRRGSPPAAARQTHLSAIRKSTCPRWSVPT